MDEMPLFYLSGYDICITFIFMSVNHFEDNKLLCQRKLLADVCNVDEKQYTVFSLLEISSVIGYWVDFFSFPKVSHILFKNCQMKSLLSDLSIYQITV